MGNLNGRHGHALLYDVGLEVHALLAKGLCKREGPIAGGVGDARLGHKGPLAVNLNQKAFVNERLECLADGSARNAEHSNELVLRRNFCGRRPRLGVNPFAQKVGDLQVKRVGLCARGKERGQILYLLCHKTNHQCALRVQRARCRSKPNVHVCGQVEPLRYATHVFVALGGGFLESGSAASHGSLATKAAALSQACSDGVAPPVRSKIEIVEHQGSAIVVATIEEMLPRDKPCYVSARGMYRGLYIRSFDGDRRLSPLRN